MNVPDISISGDYATVSVGELSCYYGYEVEDPITGEWCFTSENFKTKHTVTVPSSKLGVDDECNVAKCLIAGMAIAMEADE